MHLQIRKKEKYLLFSMVLYLLIVSSALFLIFSPVRGYDIAKQFNETGSNCSTQYSRDFTYAHFAGYLYPGDTFPTVPNEGACQHNGWGSAVNNNSYLVAEGCSLGYPAYSGGNAVILQNGVPWNTPYTLTNASRGYPVYQYLNCAGSQGYVDDWYQVSWDSPVPVITDFTVEKSCYNPNESVILHADVTGTVNTWNWKVYDLEGNVISETSDPVDTVTYPLNVIGSLAAKVTVTNSAGTDDDYRTAFINVTQPGECNFTPYNPFPTVNVTPTQNVFVTITMPPSVIVNITGVNDIINNSYLGNMSLGYRQYVDGIGEGFNTTITGVVNVVQSPLTMVVNGIAEGVSLFTISVNSLMSYTTIPLAIVGITLSYYPWQIITLITAGIAIDAAFVLIFGVR